MVNTTGNLIVENLSIFPNPTKDVVRISDDYLTRFSSIMVYDVSGRKMYENQVMTAHQIEVDMSDWEDGIYVVVLRAEQGSESAKVIKH